MQDNSFIMYALISYGLQPLKINWKSVIHKKKKIAAITGVIITIILYLQEL